MCTKLGSSQAGEGAIVNNVRLAFRGKKEEYRECSPQKRPHGSTGSRNNVDGRKRRHGFKKGVEVDEIQRIYRDIEKVRKDPRESKREGHSIRVNCRWGVRSCTV